MTYLRRLCIFPLNHYATSHIIYLCINCPNTCPIFNISIETNNAEDSIQRGYGEGEGFDLSQIFNIFIYPLHQPLLLLPIPQLQWQTTTKMATTTENPICTMLLAVVVIFVIILNIVLLSLLI